jgi:hypothetical protein
MNIEQLTRKPQLEEILIDDPDIVKTYGEPIKFWMKDHLDLNTYFDFYRFQSEAKSEELFQTLRKIVLNNEGLPVIKEDEVLPTDITINVLLKVNETLGKSKTKSLIPKTGQPQE